MKKFLKLIAVIEGPHGTVYEQEIASKSDITGSFSQLEKEQALDRLFKFLGRGFLVCDVYEDIRL